MKERIGQMLFKVLDKIEEWHGKLVNYATPDISEPELSKEDLKRMDKLFDDIEKH